MDNWGATDVLLCLLEILRDDIMVAEEQPDSDEREDNVYPRSQPWCFLQCKFLRIYGLLLRAQRASKIRCQYYSKGSK